MAGSTISRRIAGALHGRNILQLLSEMASRGAHGGSRVLQRRLLGRRFIQKRVHDYHLLLDADDPGIGRQLLSRGCREPEQKFIVERVLQPGMVAFDLGANIGYYTIMMARLVGADGCVYAVEPCPENFRLLQENVRSNRPGNILLDEVAIGASDGERQLMIAGKSNWHSLHVPRLNPNVPWHAKYARDLVGSVPVRTLSLPTYLRDKVSIDLLRMDLEGSEVEIMRGIADLPRAQTRGMKILFETHPEFYDPTRNDMRGAIEQLCSRHGYRFEFLVSDFHYGSRRDPRAQSGQSVFERYGYGAAHIVKQFRNRAIFANLRTVDAIELVCTSECVHAALMSVGSDCAAGAQLL